MSVLYLVAKRYPKRLESEAEVPRDVTTLSHPDVSS